MKKSRIILLVMMLLFIIPTFVKAEGKVKGFIESNAIVVGQTKKYLKTVDVYDDVLKDQNGIIIDANLLSSKTYELTEKEWNNIDLKDTTMTRDSTTIQTTYKLMTTTLYYSNGYYRYQNQLNWLNFPSVRSYDIIAIGHYNSITPLNTPSFHVNYVTASGGHYTTTLCYQQTFSSGVSATFPLPLQNLQSLDILYYFDAKKVNPSNTIYYQAAFGDYAHGINNSLTYSEALNHVVNGSLGIVHDSSVFSKFDTINEASVYWNGTW